MEGHFIPSGFTRVSEGLRDAHLAFDSAQGTRIDVAFVHDGIARVTHRRLTDTKPLNLASIYSNEANDTGFAVGARSRFSFPAPDISHGVGSTTTTAATTPELALNVDLTKDGDLALSWTHSSQSEPFLRDLAFRAYPMSRNAAYHYVCRNPWDLHFGLGERASPLLLNGRRFRLEGRDSLGYDAERTDPLYKTVPYYVTLDSRTGFAFGVYYHTYASGYIDLGCEIDALWGPFRYFQTDAAELEMYIFVGPTIEGCVEKLALITGTPALPPKYALGYLASAMGYAEAEDAQEQIARFPELCGKHDIPCDLLHLSSGYTVDPATGARNVFTWNTGRFPDAPKLFEDLRREGIRVAANIKPWLLKLHPDFATLAATRGFVWDPSTDTPSMTRLWSAGEGATATGSYFDFLSPSGSEFWYKGVLSLLDTGIEGIWIDNNEYSISDDLHTFNTPFGTVTAGKAGRSLQTLYMALISRKAMLERFPTKRPFLLTRSASPLMHNVCAQSWSGDNLTSWQSMRGSIAIGLNAGLSLWSNYGHDVGGFVGPVPGSEMLARWVQLMSLQPRFCLHSWKVKEGIVTEPWMHPEVLDIIRSAIHFRYSMIPYLYSLLHEAHETGHPFLRPLVYHYSTDRVCQTEHSSFLVGRDLLHAPITEEGSTTKKVYIPEEDGGWWDFWSGTKLDRRGFMDVAVPLDQHGALFARAGSLITTLTKIPRYVGDAEGETGERRVLCFPLPAGQGRLCETTFVEDDGLSLDPDGLERYKIRLLMRNKGAEEVEVGFKIEQRAKTWQLPIKTLCFVLPQGETRRLVIMDGVKSEERKLPDGRTELGVRIE